MKPEKSGTLLARHVRDGDYALIINHMGNNEREVRVFDRAWLLDLAASLEKARYIPTSHGLWVSDPEIKVFRQDVEILSLMRLGTILRVDCSGMVGDFIVGDETGVVLSKLARDKLE